MLFKSRNFQFKIKKNYYILLQKIKKCKKKNNLKNNNKI